MLGAKVHTHASFLRYKVKNPAICSNILSVAMKTSIFFSIQPKFLWLLQAYQRSCRQAYLPLGERQGWNTRAQAPGLAEAIQGTGGLNNTSLAIKWGHFSA